MFPHIDPSVKHVTIGQIRKATPTQLRESPHVVYETLGTAPVAVVLPYETYQEIQKTLALAAKP